MIGRRALSRREMEAGAGTGLDWRIRIRSGGGGGGGGGAGRPAGGQQKCRQTSQQADRTGP